ncbi:MAG: PIG-L family deacetylase [Acholeplasma sp.]|jgi:LmbE family N-acetylglucosaminyl deacetylase|nr:MAG: PIG-L family deacetylase [Acholeplasma sp.]
MKLNKPQASWYIPDNKELSEAIKRTTHMSIAAHQDDIEIMAYDGILQCLGHDDQWFLGVVVTNGSGSAREGIYKDYTDEDMIEVRRIEQKKAATIGEFGALALLEYSSKETKDPNNKFVVDDLERILLAARPEILYTHNLADKHDTHIGVTTKVIQALRRLPKEVRPKKVYGCEVWRDLDWMLDEEKIQFNVSGHPDLAQALVEVFDSQIAGGKRYDVATIGRRAANATYAIAHKVDRADQIINAMDLTPLIEDDTLDIVTYVTSYIERFKKDVFNRIKKMMD